MKTETKRTVSNTFSILKTLPSVYLCYNYLNHDQTSKIKSITCTPKSDFTQFLPLLPGLGNRKQLFWETKASCKTRLHVLAFDQSHIKYSRHLDRINQQIIKPLRCIHTHKLSICFIRFISRFKPTVQSSRLSHMYTNIMRCSDRVETVTCLKMQNFRVK